MEEERREGRERLERGKWKREFGIDDEWNGVGWVWMKDRCCPRVQWEVMVVPMRYGLPGRRIQRCQVKERDEENIKTTWAGGGLTYQMTAGHYHSH